MSDIDYTKKPIQKRGKKIIDWIEIRVNDSLPRPISRTELYTVFGNTHRSPGKELLALVLEVTDSYYNHLTGTCKKYRKRKEGVLELKQKLGLVDYKPALPAEFVQQLESGIIPYTKKNHRDFSPIQFVPKHIRNPELFRRGYKYQYDIEACAPTLLYQYAQREYRSQYLSWSAHRQRRNPPVFFAEHIDNYINNRSQVRTQIATETGSTEEQVKEVINGLFNGSPLSCYWDSQLFISLGSNHHLIKQLQSNTTLCGIRDDIHKMWKILREVLPVRYTTDARGITKRKRSNGKDKSKVYFQLEEQVGDVIRAYVRRTKQSFREVYWLHDGWVDDEFIDPNEIVSEVRRKTGYLIKLDWAILEE